jgi:integration host factor subunit alpha
MPAFAGKRCAKGPTSSGDDGPKSDTGRRCDPSRGLQSSLGRLILCAFRDIYAAYSSAGGQTMTGKTVTRVDLYAAVYEKVGLSRSESLALVESVLKEITDTLEKGETVKLASFGSFIVRKKNQRVGRNPKTGTEVPISPRRVIVFKSSPILKQQTNGTRSDTKTPVAELGLAPAR